MIVLGGAGIYNCKMKWQTPAVMRVAVLAMMPAVGAAAYIYGAGVLLQVGIAVCAAAVAEFVCLRLRGVSAAALADGSAVVAGVIVGFAMPPFAPWFVAAFAAASGMILAKHCYGGLGNNVFNPAMAGYALAFVSFPAHFDGWVVNETLMQTVFGNIDAISSPTPLSAARLSDAVINESPPMLLPIACIVGGTALLILRIADWRLTFGFLFGAFVVALLYDDIATILHGGLMFAAFFVITDPATAAATSRGRLLYAFGAGAFAIWLRKQGAHADSVAFAILAANMLAPLFDRFANGFRD